MAEGRTYTDDSPQPVKELLTCIRCARQGTRDYFAIRTGRPPHARKVTIHVCTNTRACSRRSGFRPEEA